jgi:Glycosyl hydrolase family 63 N-terminal domain
VVPIDLPTLTSLPQFGGDYRRSMLWGTYRPGLYFGVQQRTAAYRMLCTARSAIRTLLIAGLRDHRLLGRGQRK